MAHQPIPYNTFGGVATRWDAENLPPGHAQLGRNVKFLGNSVISREGSSAAFESGAEAPVTGLGEFVTTGGVRVVVAFDGVGSIFREDPVGSGGGYNIYTNSGNGLYMESDTMLNMLFMGFSDLQLAPVAASYPQAEPKVYYRYVDGNYYIDDIGLDPNPTPAAAGNPTSVGDMTPGIRYATVLFKTRTGYISGMTNASVLRVELPASGSKVTISGIPLGPSNTVARIVAFTEAGSSSAGPYYYIALDDVLEEMAAPVTATIVSDNTTVTAEFNFTDNYLISTVDVTNFFNKIKLPNQVSVYFCKTLRRLIWVGENQSIYRVSEPDDPETYMSTTGYIYPAQGDGQKAIAAREFKSELYLLKEDSGHLVLDASTNPSQWKTGEKWTKFGPSGSRAVDVCDEFMAIAGKAGLYTWDGLTSSWRSYEISGAPENGQLSWDRINWSYGYLVWVTIDTEAKEIHIGVPLDQSTIVSHEFVCSYADGWKNRKWSLNDRQWTCLKRLHRPLAAPANPEDHNDNRVAASQLCGGSSNPDGKVTYIDPSTYNDIGQGFVSEFVTRFEPAGSYGQIYQLGAIELSVKGQGQLNIQAIPVQGTARNLRQLTLAPTYTDFVLRPQGQKERWAFRITTNNDPGSWMAIKSLTVHMNMIWQRGLH